jgi:nucleotide-binding universal stress UspA family protein
MKRILVAYDGSPGAELAIHDLIYAGLPERAEARIITIADVWLPPGPPGEGLLSEHPSLAAAQGKAAEILRDCRKTAVHGAQLLHGIFPAWTVSNSASADSPAWGILTEEKHWNADLIIIGSHGRSPLEKFFLGSVSYKVAAEAECSVRVVRPKSLQTHQNGRILIGFDGSEDSSDAIDEVLERNWRGVTEVQLVTVIDPKLKSSIRTKRNFLQIQNSGDDRIEKGLEALLQNARERFQIKGIKVACHLLEGDPKHLLLHHSAKNDVGSIFLGARGLEHGERLFLGTLASAICTRAHCTVEIVRRPANT